MTDIEQKALALLNEVLAERVHWQMTGSRTDNASIEALCRAIEQHEATKQELADFKQELSDFRQEVSDAVKGYFQPYDIPLVFQRFIIHEPKRHPLSEVWRELFVNSYNLYEFIDALEARGLEIREKGQ